jgi:CTP:molybdopterin cytidylyltransferase MocA
MNTPYENLTGLLLAAGGSRRLGQPKQLCIWQGQTLVERAADILLSVCGGGVTVVTGAESAAVARALGERRVNIVENLDWQSGMAGSLASGIASAAETGADGVLIMLCDQPLLTSDDVARLADFWTNHPVSPAASSYSGVVGVPAIIPLNLLLNSDMSETDGGARGLLRHREDVRVLDMPNAAVDIDTPADLQNLTNNQN